eukprot:gene11127-3187_t
MATPSAPQSPQLIRRSNERRQLDELNNEFSSYVSRVEILKQENEELRAELDAIRLSRANFENSQVQRFQAKNNTLQEEIRAKHGEISHLTTCVNELRNDLQRSKEETSHLQSSKQSVQEQLNTAQSTISNLEGNVSSLKNDISSKDALITELQQRIDSLEAELGRQTSEAQEDRSKRISAELKVDELELKLADFIAESDAKVASLEQQVRESARRTVPSERTLSEALKEAKEQYKASFNNYKEQFRQYYEQQPIIEPDEEGLKERERLEEELVAWRLKYEDLQRESSGSSHEISALKSKIDALQDTIDKLRESHTRSLRKKEEFIFKLTKSIQEKDNLYHELLDERFNLDEEIERYRRELTRAVKAFEERQSPLSGVSSFADTIKATAQNMISLSGRRSVERQPRTGQNHNADMPPPKMARLSETPDELNHSTTTVETNTQGPVAVSDVDHHNGSYITLKNVSKEELDVIGWAVTVTNQDLQLGTFELPSLSVAPQSTIKIHPPTVTTGEENSVVWDDFPNIAEENEVAVYAFDPNDNESSTW